jgi:hypothetical protein
MSRPTYDGRSAVKRLTGRYRALESSFEIRHNADYEALVVPNGNGVESIHRWFRLKEAFSRRLLPRLLKDVGLSAADALTVLDPYAGSGTTAVSLAEALRDGSLRRGRVDGFECNPFLALVASAKLSAMQSPSTTFLGLAKKVAAAAARNKVEPARVPDLSAFKNPAYFDRQDLTKLLQLRQAVDACADAGADPLDVALARVCLGASVEPVSRLRRDGRALRHQPEKERVEPVAEFLRRAEAVDEDMPRRAIPIRGRITLGDGRTLSPRPPRSGSVDLVVFSPPYPNNIDYTEVYKLEAWLLGLIQDADAFAAQRLKTVYSHPSLLRTELADDPDATASAAVEALLAAVPADRYERARTAMIRGYLSDMALTLRTSLDTLRDGGHLIYVVGNSLHGADDSAFVIAADILIADLARRIGFEVDRIDVARQLRRRQVSSHYLRESVVFLRRPSSSARSGR